MTTDPQARAEEVLARYVAHHHAAHIAAALAEAGLLIGPNLHDVVETGIRYKREMNAARAELAEVKARLDPESEHRWLAAAKDAERRGAVAALREAADAVGSDGDWLRARADRLTKDGACGTGFDVIGVR